MSSSHTKNSISFLLFSINKAQSWIDLRAGNVPYFIWQCTVYLDEIIIEEGSSPSIATKFFIMRHYKCNKCKWDWLQLFTLFAKKDTQCPKCKSKDIEEYGVKQII